MRTIQNSAVKHIVDNFNIFGFGNQETALLQSIKELLENSIDACKVSKSLTENMHITVQIKPSDLDHVIILEVSDDGAGIDNPSVLLRCFCTSKDSSNDEGTLSTGRFGVGLSTCLVYSLVNTHVPMRLVTKCKNSPTAMIADFVLDANGNPECLQKRCIDGAGLTSGTRIKLHLPLENLSVVQNVTTAVETYLKRLDSLPTTFCRIEYLVQLEGYERSFSFSGHDPVIASCAIQSSTAMRSQFISRFEKLQCISGRQCVDCAVVLVGNDTFQIAIILTLMEPAATSTECTQKKSSQRNGCESEEEEDADEQHDNEEECNDSTDRGHETANTHFPMSTISSAVVLPLEVWRYANNVPLIDYEDDALSCCISAAMRSIPWTNYGFKLKLSLDHINTNTSVSTSSKNNMEQSSSISLLHAPHWELHCLRDEVAVEVQSNQYTLLLTIDLIGSNIPYANMRKTSIGKENKRLLKLITSGIEEALSKLQRSETAGMKLLMTRKQYKESLVLNKYIPSIASSFSKMMACIKDPKDMDFCLKALSIGATSDATTTASAINGMSSATTGASMDISLVRTTIEKKILELYHKKRNSEK